jgi:CMP-N,N'-diacetyllegionaminic acid synthase
MAPYAAAGPIPGRSQDLPPAYQLNGAIYVATRDDLFRDRSFLGPRTHALVMANREESLDIDDAWDWRFAEYIAGSIEPLGKPKRGS